MGEHVTGVIPASTFGLLPTPLDETPSVPVNQRRHPLSIEFNNVLELNGKDHAALSGGTSDGVDRDATAAAKMQHVGGRVCAIFNTVSPPMLLKAVLHLFGHGTPLSLELVLNNVGEEALRALRTPDVSIDRAAEL